MELKPTESVIRPPRVLSSPVFTVSHTLNNKWVYRVSSDLVYANCVIPEGWVDMPK